MNKALLVALLATSLISACSPNNSNTSTTPSTPTNPGNPMGVAVDQDIFLKVSFGGKNLATYGLKFTNSAYAATAYSVNPLFTSTTNTSGGQTNTRVVFKINPVFTSYNSYGIQDGDLATNFAVNRTGDIVGGNYKLDPDFSRTITDKNNGNKNYDIDTAGFGMQITSVDLRNVKGTFSFKLKDGSNLIPATGSFSLWKQ
jgi:hypothetical protein